MPDQAYWQRRRLERFDQIDTLMERDSARIRGVFNDTLRGINRDIERIWRNYAKETGVDEALLKQLVSRGEQKRLQELLAGIERPEYVARAFEGRITRLEALKLELYANVKQTYYPALTEFDKHAMTVLSRTYLMTAFDVEKGTKIATQLTGISKTQINTIMRARWSGKNYSQRLWNNTSDLARYVSKRVPQGLLAGHSQERVARDVRKKFGTSKYQADRLVRTETTYFEGQAESNFYEEVDLDRYQYMAVMDARTSVICRDLDDKIFYVKDQEIGVNYPPMHVNCRSSTVGYISDDYDPPRRVKQTDGSYSLAGDYKSYNAWAKANGYDELMPLL